MGNYEKKAGGIIAFLKSREKSGT